MTDLDLEELKRLAAAHELHLDPMLDAHIRRGSTFSPGERYAIVAAVNSLPALIAEVERLRGENPTAADLHRAAGVEKMRLAIRQALWDTEGVHIAVSAEVATEALDAWEEHNGKAPAD